MDIHGKSALVTGGARGIGLACVKELLRNGARVVICDCKSEIGENLAKDLAGDYGQGNVVFIETDVTKHEEFENAFKTAISMFKTLDIVINNAGIADLLNWERLINVNLGGVIRGTLLALQYMGKDKGGQGGVVCNMASISGLTPYASCPTYVASKHGVVGLSRSYGLPYYYNKTGVRVLTMCPGITETSLVAVDMIAGLSVDQLAQLQEDKDSSPVQKPEHVAVGMMELLQKGESGSVWVCEGGEPVYRVHLPRHEALKREANL